jgi:glycosyltransferase involved in cell wall biosynthesis
MFELGKNRTLYSSKKIIDFLADAAIRFDKVYFISCQYYVNVISMFIAMILKVKYKNIKFINSERNHFQEFAVKGGWKNKIVLYLIPWLYRFADVIVANSSETAEDLGKLVCRKVYWVYNPTVNHRIESLSKEEVTETWFTNDPRPCVVGVGRFSLQKDFATLINAFRLVRDEMDVKLLLLGEGELRSELEQEIINLDLSTDVYLPGFVSNPYKFLATASVFVLSSRYEGLPNALIEAIYLGIPCVSTNCKSGPREILFEGEGGALVPVGNERKMADSILEVIRNPKLAEEKSTIAASGLHRFNYDSVKDEFESVINL